jgi:hypothetical protein
MTQYPDGQAAILILQNAILALLILRVLVTGLFRKYPYFFGYLLVACLQVLVSVLFSVNSRGYVYAWLVTQALLTFLCVLMVLELYTQVLCDLKGIARRFRRYIKIGLGLAILASLLLLLLEQTPQTTVATFTVIDRVLVTSLLIFVLLLTAFLVYYPVPINRNLVVYSIGYAVYFMAKGSGLLYLNRSYTISPQVSILVIAASTVAMLLWLIGLSSRGEEKTLVIGHRWNREDHDKVLERLKALNARLLRAGRQ